MVVICALNTQTLLTGHLAQGMKEGGCINSFKRPGKEGLHSLQSETSTMLVASMQERTGIICEFQQVTSSQITQLQGGDESSGCEYCGGVRYLATICISSLPHVNHSFGGLILSYGFKYCRCIEDI